MIANLDIDVLKTFMAIADQGSFARAAEDVNKTQSAVSMQMKRLEDVLQRALFVREGRQNRLTLDGERMLDYARRIARLNDEAVATFTRPELTGLVRLGTPDDYADRLLPEILARFSRTHPLVQVNVECVGSPSLAERTRANDLDLSLVTCEAEKLADRTVRREPLVWVTSSQHCAHTFDPLPLAVSDKTCVWRSMMLEAIESTGHNYRIAYESQNSNAVAAAVISGLAVAAVPRMVLRPGMRVLSPQDGFPDIGEFEIGLVHAPGEPSAAVAALADHICDSLCNARQDSSQIAAE